MNHKWIYSGTEVGIKYFKKEILDISCFSEVRVSNGGWKGCSWIYLLYILLTQLHLGFPITALDRKRKLTDSHEGAQLSNGFIQVGCQKPQDLLSNPSWHK